MIAELRRDLGRAVALAAAVTLVVALAAATVHVLWASGARTLLDYRFPGVPDEASEAAAILVNNARKLGGLLGLVAILQAGYLTRGRDRCRAPATVLTAGCDLIFAALLAGTVGAVVLGLGGYGGRMVRAVLPHGPVEVVAFAAATVLYLDARRGPIAARRASLLALVSLALLALAALLETYISV
jgi:hypothetical protein